MATQQKSQTDTVLCHAYEWEHLAQESAQPKSLSKNPFPSESQK